MDPGILLGDDFESAEPSRIVGSDLGIETGTDPCPEFEESHTGRRAATREYSDHLLAQHYTRNLTALYSSKDRGWNYYTYSIIASATPIHLFYPLYIRGHRLICFLGNSQVS